MEKTEEKMLFERAPLMEAVRKLALPCVMGQIILVIYNMADTFFMGMTGDEAKLTALSISMPAFMILSAISNLFGIGGSSAISRSLGSGSREKAGHISSFALWSTVLTVMAYMGAVALLIDPMTDILGGTAPSVHDSTVSYIFITVVIGGIPTALSALISHLIRAEGKGFHASMGIAFGGVLNIVLDPVFMFVILPEGYEIIGAAAATALSNAAALMYFTVILVRDRKKTVLRFSPAMWKCSDGIASDVLSSGLPACIMTLCENISFAVLDKLVSAGGVMAQAGLGVAKKINMLAHSIVRGMAQGMLPIIAYNYASGNIDRMKKAMRCSALFSVGSAVLCMTFSLSFSTELMEIFIEEGSDALGLGRTFLMILALGGPFSAFAYTSISFFQAVGEGRRSFMLALLRKGIVDIPLMFVLGSFFGAEGTVAATPLADAAAALASMVLVARYMAGRFPAEKPVRAENRARRLFPKLRAVV